MKVAISHVILLLTFCLFLMFPIYTLSGAASGLVLWYNVLLPNLLPFIIITTLIIRTNAFLIISNILGTTIGRIFGVSSNGSIAIIVGFLCGYPMGAKVINDLYETKSISLNEAQYLLSFCNNTSPMFLIGFFVYQILEMPSFIVYVFLAIYLAPVIISFVTRKIYSISFYNSTQSGTVSKKSIGCTFSLLDTAIIDSITLIIKIGGYVMLFSIFITLCSHLLLAYIPWISYITPLLEITNGLAMYQTILNPIIRYHCMIFLVSFGGLCAVGQTGCVIENKNIKLSHYFIQKIITAIIAVIISVILLLISHNIHLL